MLTRNLSILLACAAIAGIACSGGSEPSNQPAGGAEANSTMIAAGSVAKVGETRSLLFYVGGRIDSKPAEVRAALTGASIKTLAPPSGPPALRPVAVVELRVDNPNPASTTRPDMTLITPEGKRLGYYNGASNGPRNVADVVDLPGQSQLEGAFYFDFQSSGLAPPTSLAGWTVSIKATGVTPLDGAEAIWRIE